MCGIFGHKIEGNINLEKSIASLKTLVHRGPDQQNFYYDDKVFIGHCRLSILDLSNNGKQPMESEDCIITVNGEIYNYIELKKELELKYNFKSQSDSEIILHGFKEWGLYDLIKRIDGMYSIVIYDKKKKQIHLIRDRYGIKPLYYRIKNNDFIWASELKAIKYQIKNEDLEIDNTAIYDYLTYLYIPTPKTLYKDVYKLTPAHVLSFDLATNESTITKYWELNTTEKPISIENATKLVKTLINNSVKEQMISDVPIGFFLSGGIDSSIVVATASEFSKKINTYSIGFDVEKHNETKYAKIISVLFNTYHHVSILKYSEADSLVKNMKQWYDEPFADTSALPTYLVSSFAKKNATVVLTGDGGDELFGGYDWYDRFIKYRKWRIRNLNFLKKPIAAIKKKYRYKIAGRIANQLEYRMLDDLELYVKLLGGLLKHEKEAYRKQFNIPSSYNDYWYFEKFYETKLSLRKRLQYLDFHTYLHDDIFTKVDRASMAVSLECRVPFMKKELVEFAFSLPENITYYNENLKGLLKEAYIGILPGEILFRRKKGFSIPLKQWSSSFLHDNKTQQEQLLSLFLEGEK